MKVPNNYMQVLEIRMHRVWLVQKNIRKFASKYHMYPVGDRCWG